MKNFLILSIAAIIFFSCKKGSPNEPPNTFIPWTLQKCMDSIGLSYNVYYQYTDINGNNVGKIKISTDTSITDQSGGITSTHLYSFESNNAYSGNLAITFKPKDAINWTTATPVHKLSAGMQYFQITKNLPYTGLYISGFTSYGADETYFKIIH